jgi:ArsR family transcriptional regulator
MLTIARNTLENTGFKNCQVRQGDMYDLPAKDGAHDAVLFHQVLHYADQPHSALDEATRVLKSKGTLVIVDFAPHKQDFLRDEHSHRHLGFSEKTISNMGTTSGLVEKSITHLDGGELTVTIWVFEKP